MSNKIIDIYFDLPSFLSSIFLLILSLELENLMLFANFSIYGVAKDVIIVTTLSIGNIDEVIAPTSCPPFAITKDISPFAVANPKPTFNMSILSTLDFANTANTRRNFTAKAVSINTITGTMYNGISEIFTNAPIDTKNNAENTSLNGIVITFATVALLDSATKTPAKNAPITTDKPKILAMKDRPKASPNITIKRRA